MAYAGVGNKQPQGRPEPQKPLLDHRPSNKAATRHPATGSTHMRNIRKKSWLVATTAPMKKPTAMLVWNLRITMVPPMHSPTTMTVDQRAEKDSDVDRVDTVQNVMTEMRSDRARMEYLVGG